MILAQADQILCRGHDSSPLGCALLKKPGPDRINLFEWPEQTKSQIFVTVERIIKTFNYRPSITNIKKNPESQTIILSALREVSKYGVISGPYFPVFGLNKEIYEVNLRIQSKYRKIRTRNNSVFGHFSRIATK